jgi:hypothetical protein
MELLTGSAGSAPAFEPLILIGHTQVDIALQNLQAVFRTGPSFGMVIA